jgi:hypothetical protein
MTSKTEATADDLYHGPDLPGWTMATDDMVSKVNNEHR